MNNDSVLMKRTFAALFPGYEGVKPGAYSLVTQPKGAKSSGWLKPSMFWSVSADSKYTEESKKFIDWFVNDSGSRGYSNDNKRRAGFQENARLLNT